MTMKLFASLLCALLPCVARSQAPASPPGSGPTPAPTHVELVLDASGSMWKQLADGEYRIVAAKAVLADFVSGLPADEALNVGLRVYGSQLSAREEGACQDSALLVPLAGIDRDALLRVVRDTQAKGATPIAYSLQQAAADFAAEGRKVIVLVTDGEESCGGDVRGTLEALKAQGLEVELRIVGFDLDDRAVRSFEGLGTFENARSAAELAAALGRAVAVEAAAAGYPVSVTVTRDGAPAADGVRVEFRDAVSGEAHPLQPTAGPGELAAELPAGAYEARVEDAFSDAPLTVGGLSVTPEGPNAFAFELAQEVEVALTVQPAEPVAGSRVTVGYAGAPAGAPGWVTVVPVELPDDAYLDWAETSGTDGELLLRTPAEAGALEARFHLKLPEGGSRVIGRSEAVRSQAASASLAAPAEVGAGAGFEVTWQGPDNDGDYLTVVPVGTPDGVWAHYAYTRDGNPLQLTAPLEAGAYEVRYGSDYGGGVLARTPLTVTAATYGVQAPAEVAGNSDFEVHWSGPDNEGDYLTIVPVDAPEGMYLDYAYTRDGNPVTLRAPVEAGAYEVRYSSEQASPNPSLARAPVTVTAADYALEAPAAVAAGQAFEVDWQGPGHDSDYLTIVPVGTEDGVYADYWYTRDGDPLTVTAPAAPGAYEVRLQSDGVQGVLARRPLTVK